MFLSNTKLIGLFKLTSTALSIGSVSNNRGDVSATSSTSAIIVLNDNVKAFTKLLPSLSVIELSGNISLYCSPFVNNTLGVRDSILFIIFTSTDTDSLLEFVALISLKATPSKISSSKVNVIALSTAMFSEPSRGCVLSNVGGVTSVSSKEFSVRDKASSANS